MVIGEAFSLDIKFIKSAVLPGLGALAVVHRVH